MVSSPTHDWALLAGSLEELFRISGDESEVSSPRRKDDFIFGRGTLDAAGSSFRIQL
jgi:hypothetical protein